MSDLISRQDAIKQFCEFGTDMERQGKTMITMVDAKYAFIKVIESLPSAEKTGSWIRTKNPLGEEITICSKCGTIIKQGYLDYCAKCGCRMVGDNT